MPLSSSTPRSNWGWLVALVLILGLWVGYVPQAAGQGTKERDALRALLGSGLNITLRPREQTDAIERFAQWDIPVRMSFPGEE